MPDTKREHEIASLGYTWRVNCWGTTKYVLHLSDKIEWVEEDDMMEAISDFEAVEQPERGDIIVIVRGTPDNFSLVHTAVYERAGRYFQKPGAHPAGIATRQQIMELYGTLEGANAFFHLRPVHTGHRNISRAAKKEAA